MKKRVVILSAFLTPFRSGAEACVEEVSARLKDRYDITIVTARLRKDLPRIDTLNGVRVVRVGVGRPIDKWLFPLFAPSVAQKIKPNLVHAVLETFAGLALIICDMSMSKSKTLLTLQTTNRSFLRKPIIVVPDRVTAISSALVENALQLGRKKVTLIPNGIALKDISAACEKHKKVPGRILFVGRLEKMKGIDVLLAALAKLRIANCELRIVGDGSERQNLEKMAKDLGISDRVTFVGYLKPSEVMKEYAEAEIFCGLSRSEALGNVFIEAQAAGCAVLATNVGGIPDIVKDSQTGLLVNPDDSEAAAAAIINLSSDATLRHQLAAAGKEHAKDFDWGSIADRYAAVYDEMMPA